MSKKKNFGKTYNQLKVGQKLRHWPRKTISDSEHSLFCLLTMNHHPIHIDKVFARNTQHKKILVNGTFVFSLVVGMTVKDISGMAIANLNYEKIDHHYPVYLNDTLSAFSIVQRKETASGNKKNAKVKVFTYAENQKGKKVLSFYRTFLIKK